MPRRITRALLLLVTGMLLQGCATTSLFSPYPQQAAAWKQDVRMGRPEAAAQSLAQKSGSLDKLLYLEERGRLAQMAGNYQESEGYFSRVFDIYKKQDAEAKIRLSQAGSDAASILVNDNARPYRGYAYERIFAHGFQALNYLAQGKTTDTAVELRGAALEQRVVANEHEREIADADEAVHKHHIDLSHYKGYFEGLDTAAAGVKSAIQNAWLFYVSAAFWEGTHDWNDALVDYKKALEIHPDSDMLKADVQRVSARLDGHDDSKHGLVVISYQQGFVPPKRQVSIPIPTTQGYFAVAFPTYQPKDFPSAVPLRVRSGGQSASTRPLANVGGMAAKALKDRIPGMIMRQVLRADAKYNAQKKANRDLGLFGALATQVYNLVSEQADLRSWLTLPAWAQATRLRLPVGEHELQLSGQGGGATVKVPVISGGVTLVSVIDAGGMLRTKVMPIQETH